MRISDWSSDVCSSDLGASRSGRTELETIMKFMHTGDELVVLRLDRLDRSTRDVLNLVHELDEKGASLRILEPEEIGRASCRERGGPCVSISVVAVALKKTTLL